MRVLSHLGVRIVIKMGIIKRGVIVIMNIISHVLRSESRRGVRCVKRMIADWEENIVTAVHVGWLRLREHRWHHRVKNYSTDEAWKYGKLLREQKNPPILLTRDDILQRF